jgi:OOP family OmpA-OmpF porin
MMLKKYLSPVELRIPSGFLIVLFLIFSQLVEAQQRQGVYLFNNNFASLDGSLPALSPLGTRGSFGEEALPELSDMNKSVYRFNKNCGLQFDNSIAGQFLGASYSIEVYFRFDELNSWKRVIDFKNRSTDEGCYIFNGKLNFYNLMMSDLSPIRVNEYTHYTITRDEKTKEVRIFADGVSKITFRDTLNRAVISGDQKLNFFFDDLKVTDEASAGAVAMIRLFNYTLSPTEVMANFVGLGQNVQMKETPKAELKQGEVPYRVRLVHYKTKVPLDGLLKYQPIDNTSSQLELQTSGGSGTLPLKANKEYKLIVQSKGFIEVQENLLLTAQSTETEHVIYLQPLEVGTTVRLNSINFERGSYTLLSESFPELDKLVDLMNQNPTMNIQLSGHTDNQGDPGKNVILSEQRVDAVRDYLISKGILAKRISGKGYGGSKPVASNATEETRRLNRRVEFTIVKF